MSSEGPAEGINGSVGIADKELILTLVKQIQNYAQFCIEMLMEVSSMQIKEKFTNLWQRIT